MNIIKTIFTFIFNLIFKILRISFKVVKWVIVVVIISSVMIILGSFRGGR